MSQGRTDRSLTCETCQQTGEEARHNSPPSLRCCLPYSVAHGAPSHTGPRRNKNSKGSVVHSLRPWIFTGSGCFLCADNDNKRRRWWLVALASSRHVWLSSCQTACYIQGSSENPEFDLRSVKMLIQRAPDKTLSIHKMYHSFCYIFAFYLFIKIKI